MRTTQVTLSAKTPTELAMGRRPRDLMDLASINPERLTFTPTKQDLVNEEIQRSAMRTHLEVQQLENIRRDLVERIKFVPDNLGVGESVFYWQEHPNKIQQGRKSGKWLKMERDYCCQGTQSSYQCWCIHFSGKCKQASTTFGPCGSGRTSGFA